MNDSFKQTSFDNFRVKVVVALVMLRGLHGFVYLKIMLKLMNQ